jgi:hypothetical protein
VLKLYKREGDTLRYWEAWVHEGTLTVHQGVVGETGTETQTPVPDDEDPDMAIAQAAESLVDAGYDEPDIDIMTPLVIQYPLQGKGTGQDFEKRHAVEELLTDVLGWTGNGEVEGGETQAGRMNVFCRVMDAQTAVHTIAEALDEEDLVEGALIALVPDSGEPRVLWPPNHSGGFRV